MADDQKDTETGEKSVGEGTAVPPLIDIKNPFADDESHPGKDDEARAWVPPVP
jgi:hypothetical protein